MKESVAAEDVWADLGIEGGEIPPEQFGGFDG